MRLSFGVSIIDYFSKTYSISKWKCNQILVLIVTFLIYTVYHMSRRTMSIVKPVLFNKNCFSIHHDQNETNIYWCNWAPFDQSDGLEMLSWLDTTFLISYAVFMFFSGSIADRSNLRHFLTIGLILCGTFDILFGLGYPLKIHNYYYFIVIQAFNGIAQATGWPAVVAAVARWFGKNKKGLVFGIWGWHTSVGNIVGAAVAGAFVDFNWGLSFIVTGSISMIMALMAFLFLIPGPEYVGLTQEDNHMSDKKELHHLDSHSDTKAISLFAALKVPGVIEFSICIFFGKLVTYTFLFWLPELINQTIKVSASNSAYLSIAFDIGGGVGAVIAGYLADRSGASALTCVLLYAFGIPSLLLLYKWGAVSIVVNQCLQFIAGMFVNGPYSLIMTAVAADLGTKVTSKNALATITAIIDGTGSIGAVLGPLLTGYLDKMSTSYVFFMLMLCELLAILSLLRISINEFRRILTERKEKQKEKQINRFSYKL